MISTNKLAASSFHESLEWKGLLPRGPSLPTCALGELYIFCSLGYFCSAKKPPGIWPTSGVGVTKPISPVPLFPCFWELSNPLSYNQHVHIWRVSTQLSCVDTANYGTWLKQSNGSILVKPEMFPAVELTNGTVVTPTPLVPYVNPLEPSIAAKLSKILPPEQLWGFSGITWLWNLKCMPTKCKSGYNYYYTESPRLVMMPNCFITGGTWVWHNNWKHRVIMMPTLSSP